MQARGTAATPTRDVREAHVQHGRQQTRRQGRREGSRDRSNRGNETSQRLLCAPVAGVCNARVCMLRGVGVALAQFEVRADTGIGRHGVLADASVLRLGNNRGAHATAAAERGGAMANTPPPRMRRGGGPSAHRALGNAARSRVKRRAGCCSCTAFGAAHTRSCLQDEGGTTVAWARVIIVEKNWVACTPLTETLRHTCCMRSTRPDNVRWKGCHGALAA